MTYHGHVRNGQISLDEPVALPEGTAVKVEILTDTDGRESQMEPAGLVDLLMRYAGKGRDLPSDLAARHDHYAHGKPLS